jgi:hypothetical protein
MQTAEGLERCDGITSRSIQQAPFQDAHSYRPRDAEVQQKSSSALKNCSVAAESLVELMMSQESFDDDDGQVTTDMFLCCRNSRLGQEGQHQQA